MASRFAFVGLVALAAGCDQGEPCGVKPGQTEADCVTDPTRLSIQIEGSGRGWVQVMQSSSSLSPAPGTGLICTESCILEVPRNDWGTIWLRAGTTQRITGSSCGLESTNGYECQLTSEDQDVSVTFEKDPDELATLFLDDGAHALAFAGDGDLVLGTLTSLRRLGLDGSQRWSVARAGISLVATSATDLIVVGPDVAAYRGDGSLAWDVPHQATAVATLPDGSPIIVTTGGRVIALSAADGSIRWQSGDLGAMTVAIDDAGTVAAGAGDMVLRFDANGAPLPSWQAPAPITHLLFESTNQLVATNLVPPGTGAGPEHSLVYYRFDPSGMVTKVFMRPSSPPNGVLAAGARLVQWGVVSSGFTYPVVPPRLDILALDPAGTRTWELTKGYGYGYKGTYGADLIAPLAAASDGQTCAVAGSYEGPAGTGMGNWVGVYAIP